MNRLSAIFEGVANYSANVRLGRRLSKDELKHQSLWAKEYLLAAHRELGGMLDNVPEWKEHRKEPVPPAHDLDALVEEGVDVINYVIATLATFDVREDQFWQVWLDKQSALNQLRAQEVLLPLRPNEPVFMVDLDGCLADFRTGFLRWLVAEHPRVIGAILPTDPASTLSIDLEFGIEPGLYRELKGEFERQGGYRRLPLFPWADDLVTALYGLDARLVFVTSRPTTLSRSFRDTLWWIRHILQVRESDKFLHFTSRKAEWLQATGVNVIGCLEDDPKYIGRLAAQGYRVYVPAHGYNEGVDHGKEDLVHRAAGEELVGLVGGR